MVEEVRPGNNPRSSRRTLECRFHADEALLAAAAQGTLTDPAELEAQAARILETPLAQKNLADAMFAYFRLSSVLTVVIDDPAWTFSPADNPYSALREAAYHESELFLQDSLFSAPLDNLLTRARQAGVD